MGLAAGQARLLSITGRKSDCEFESMRLSHQKIALARELADLSNEYQNSLNQTKLVYDYYGTGDTSTQLSYGLLMYPSALNDYMPTVITDSMGRVALNSRYAAAARAAGIPQEGLGTLPSEDMRNAFVQALANEGLITEKLATAIQGLPYNQAAGFGGGTTVAVMTDSGNFDEFCEHLKEAGANITIDVSAAQGKIGYSGNVCIDDTSVGATEGKDVLWVDSAQKLRSGTGNATGSSVEYNLGAMLDGTHSLAFQSYGNHIGDEKNGVHVEQVLAIQSILDSILDQADGYFSECLDLGDGYTAKALEYAKTKVRSLYVNEKDPTSSGQSLAAGRELPNRIDYDGDDYNLAKNSQNYLGWICGSKHKNNHNRANAAISISNILEAYLTYFADYMNGISATGSDGSQVFDVNKGQTTGSHLASDNVTFEYTWKVGSEVSSDDCALATFYDTLFNQICANGWTENNNVDDNEYLQQMLQGGMMFVSKTKDDGYYYQTNYATDTYIKEVADETMIAYAESKYNTEKAKLNAKEETIDLKMKNLDTEISSLTTEYDTVKNTISKNIEKSFKRYNA